MKHLAVKTRLLRYKLNLSQNDLAMALEELLNNPVSQSKVSRLESGKCHWDIEFVQALAQLADQSIEVWLKE